MPAPLGYSTAEASDRQQPCGWLLTAIARPRQIRFKLGWLAGKGWRAGGRGAKKHRGNKLHLALQPILDTHLLHDIELRFQPVDMLFGIFQNFFQKFAGYVILRGFAGSNS